MSNAEDSKRRPAQGPRVGVAQVSPALADAAANLEKHREAVARAVEEGLDLLVFPELSLAGYRLKDSVADVAMRRDSDAWKELEALSADVALVVGLVEETPDHLFYNSAVYLEGGRTLAVHRKAYLPTYGMFDEQRYFARGRSIAAFDTKIGRVAMLVCEDMLHPSAVTVAAADGATLLVVPSASPARGVTGAGDADSNARSWEAYLQVMARTFGVYVAYCNRVGVEDGVTFWGGSEILTPAGERLAKAAYYDEGFASGVLPDDAVRRRRMANPLVRDEDLDLTINELCRIRGRQAPATEEARPERRAAFEGGDGERPRRPRPDRGGDGDAPPRRFDRAPRSFDRAPRSMDEGSGRFGRDDDRGPGRGMRPRGGFEQRGGFGRPRRDDDGPREGGDDRPRFGGDERPRFGGPPRERFGLNVRGGGDDRPRPAFGDKPRGSFGDRPRGGFGDKPRGGFGDKPRGGFGDKPRGGFGDKPRGGFGDKPRFGFGDKPRGGFGDKPRGGFGGPRRDDDGPRPRGAAFGGPRSDDDAGPRARQRPEPARKPFNKGGKGGPRGRKDR